MERENRIRADIVSAGVQVYVKWLYPSVVQLCEPINSLLFLGHFEVGFSVTCNGFLTDTSFFIEKKKEGSERLINFPKFILKKFTAFQQKNTATNH